MSSPLTPAVLLVTLVYLIAFAHEWVFRVADTSKPVSHQRAFWCALFWPVFFGRWVLRGASLLTSEWRSFYEDELAPEDGDE